MCAICIRSRQSAHDITTLITAISDKIQAASDANTRLTSVIASVHEVNTLIERITNAT